MATGEKKTQDIERFINKRLIKEMNKPPVKNKGGKPKNNGSHNKRK